jgi:hypothetical protein
MLDEIDRITVIVFVDIGMAPATLMTPEIYEKARYTVQRLLACHLSADDVISQDMPFDERFRIHAAARRLAAIHECPLRITP